MSYDFKDYIREGLFISDAARAAEVEAALDTLYQDMTSTNPNRIGPEGQAIKVQQALLQIKHDLRMQAGVLLYRMNIQRDLDFRGGDPAFSVAPRLLFRVPSERRGPQATAPLVLKSLFNGKSTAQQPVTTERTVLIYPNQEGLEEKIEDRPDVQICAVSPGEFVIIGKVGMEGRQTVWNTVAKVMKAEENPFAAFDEHGTVEDLGEILDDLRRQGIGNQYNTNQPYRDGLWNGGKGLIPPLPDREAAADQVSGFYAKPTDKTEATLRYVPGDVFLVGSGHAAETITGGGFALYEDSNGSQRYAPLSRAYAKLSMLFKRSGDSVVPERDAAPLKFAPDHPLRDFSAPVAKFLITISAINRKYAAAAKPVKDTGELPDFAGPELA